jgi:hypothetical protein
VRFLSDIRAIALTCIFLADSSGAVVSNGGFEDPVSQPGTGWYAPSAPTDWAASFGDNGLASALDGFGVPQAGDQYLFMPWFGGSTGGDVYQVVTGFTVGDAYELRFYASAWSDAGFQFGPSTITATIAGQTLVTSFDLPQQNINVGSPESPWVLRTLTFTATAASESLTFTSSRAGATGSFPALDSVSIVSLAVSVESTTWSHVKSLFE